MNKRRGLVSSIIGIWMAGSWAFGHDFWLVPPKGTLSVGQSMTVKLAVGMDFPLSLTATELSRLTVAAFGPNGEKRQVKLRVHEAENYTSATFAPQLAGTWIVTAVTAPRLIEMEAEAFNDYLLHDGLAHVLAARMDDKETGRPAVERYRKFTKALVPIGAGGRNGVADAVLGLKLEIVPLEDPLTMEVGDTLRAKVLFDGRPLAKANLCWDHPGNGEAFSGQTLTDDQGLVMVPITRTGLTTLRLIHMTHPRAKDHEWESFWSSLTFRVPE